MRSKSLGILLSFTLALDGAGPAPLAAAPRAPMAEPDWLGVVGLYPQPGSAEGQGERSVLLWLQTSRTAQDVARAQASGNPSLGCFVQDIHRPALAGAAPRAIELGDFPLTAAVLEQARQDFAPVLASLKGTFSRPRPFLLFPAVTPALPRPASPSYPSGNAALGVLYARILGQWDPADRAAFETTGKLLGTDRVLGGVHYPSDAQAGQRLGAAFATWWLDQPGHLALIQTACGEWNR